MKTGDIDVNGNHFRLKNVDNTAMNAITSPASGMEVYNTTQSQIMYYNGSAWVATAGASGSKIYNGIVAPTTMVGMNTGDQYLNTVNGFWYTFNGTTWVYDLTIKGESAANVAYTTTFQRPAYSTSKIITHNLNAQVIVSVYDSATTGYQIIPSSIQIMDANNVILGFEDWDTVSDFPETATFRVVVLAAGGSGGSTVASEDAVTTFPLAMGSNYWTPNPAGSMHLTASAIPYTTVCDQIEVYVATPFSTAGTTISVGIFTNASVGSSPIYNQYAISAVNTTLTAQPYGLFRIPLTSAVTLRKNTVYWFMVFIHGSSYGSLLQTTSMTTNVPNALGFQLDNITTTPNPVTTGSANSTRIWLQASNSAGN